MNTMLRSLALVPCLLWLPGLGTGAPTASERQETELAEELDGIITDFLGRHEIPGLAVGVVVDGRVVLAEGYGMANAEEELPVTSKTLFHVASVSKTFVATAVVQLAEKGEIDLDSPIARYLPYFELDDERAGAITVRQMLAHTSGMPDVRDYGWDEPWYDDEALEGYVRGLANRKLRSAPGEKWSYSNMAYEVLGDLIAKASEQTFEDYVESRVLEPLGMKKSTFLLERADAELLTIPHIGRREPTVSEVYPYSRIHAPSSTMHSNVEEMCRWILVHAGRGELGETRILKESSHAMMWTPEARVSSDREYGLGWFLADSAHGRWAFHGGRDMGFRSHLTVLPERNGGLVVLSNYSETPIRELREALVERAFVEAAEVNDDR